MTLEDILIEGGLNVEVVTCIGYVTTCLGRGITPCVEEVVDGWLWDIGCIYPI